VLEVGTAAFRSSQLVAADQWPPLPDDKYRRSHLIVRPHSSTRYICSTTYELGESLCGREGFEAGEQQ
jgi:hypothetical protein